MELPGANHMVTTRNPPVSSRKPLPTQIFKYHQASHCCVPELPCMDDDQSTPEDFTCTGELAPVCAQLFCNACTWPELVPVTTWKKACGKLLGRLRSGISLQILQTVLLCGRHSEYCTLQEWFPCEVCFDSVFAQVPDTQDWLRHFH